MSFSLIWQHSIDLSLLLRVIVVLSVCSNLWRAENQMQQRIASLRDELSKKDQALRSITGKVLFDRHASTLLIDTLLTFTS